MKKIIALLSLAILSQRAAGFQSVRGMRRSFATRSSHAVLPSSLLSLQSKRTQMRMMSSMGDGPQNPMNPNIYTEKAFDAIAKLPQYADKFSTQYVEAPLLLRSLLDDKAGLGQRVLNKAGVDGNVITDKLDAHLNKQPKVTTSGESQKSMGRR